MKKILIGVSATFIGLIIVASIVLEFINWNQFKPQIREQVQKATGRNLEIGGDLKLRLLPTPKLIANEIKFENHKKSKEPYMATVKKLKVGVSLLPLLSKHLKVTKVILDTPVIHIEKFNGEGNWVFKAAQASEAQPQDSTTTPVETDSPSNFEVGVDRAEVTNGTFVYKDKSNVTKITDVEIEMSMGSLKGPYTFDGSLKVDGTPYKLNLKTDQLSDDVPANVTLTVSQKLAQLTFTGMVDHVHKTANGQFKGNANFQEAMTFNGHVEASEKQVKLSQLNIQTGKHKGTGDVLVTLQPALNITANLSGLPGGTLIKVNGKPHGDGAQGRATIQSQSLYQLLGAFGTNVDLLKKQSQLNYTSNFIYSKKGGVNLQGIVMKLNNASLSGSLKASEGAKGYSASMDLSTNNLDTLLALADVKSKRKFGSAKVKGSVSGNPAHLNINQTYSLLNGVFSVKGSVSNPATNLSYDLFVKANHPNLAQLLGDASKPRQRLVASTRVKGSPTKVDLSQLNLNVGSVRAMGSATYGMGKRTTIKADLNVPQGNLMHLVGGGAKAAQSSSSASSGGASSGGSPSNGSKWSKDPIDLTFLKQTDADIKIKAADLSVDKLPLKNANIGLKLNNGNLDLSATSQAAGGMMNTRLSASITNTIAANIQLYLENVSLKQVGTALADYKDLEGRGTIQFTGKTQGRSQHELISNLNGKAKLTTKEAVLKGWDMEHLGQSIGSLQGLTKSFTFDKMMGSVKDSRKQTRLQASANFNVQNGVVNTNDFKVIGDGIKADGKGAVNLPAWNMNSKADVYLTGLDDQNAIPAYAKGPLDNLSYGMQTGKLMQFVYTKFLSGTIEKALGLKKGSNPLGQLLGLKPSKQAPQQAGQQPQEGSNQDELGKAVGSVLKGLFGN